MILLAAVITVSVSMASVGGSKTEETKEGTIIKATADCSVQFKMVSTRSGNYIACAPLTQSV